MDPCFLPYTIENIPMNVSDDCTVQPDWNQLKTPSLLLEATDDMDMIVKLCQLSDKNIK